MKLYKKEREKKERIAQIILLGCSHDAVHCGADDDDDEMSCVGMTIEVLVKMAPRGGARSRISTNRNKNELSLRLVKSPSQLNRVRCCS